MSPVAPAARTGSRKPVSKVWQRAQTERASRGLSSFVRLCLDGRVLSLPAWQAGGEFFRRRLRIAVVPCQSPTLPGQGREASSPPREPVHSRFQSGCASLLGSVLWNFSSYYCAFCVCSFFPVSRASPLQLLRHVPRMTA